ncbi:phosphoribosyltransferase family protein [Dactylosporangium sp. AC04546]|uniref:phosphoribosyltransferase n=1 Tax=Dactylosporangium sp. AC04546 TaxID=2862460 RepID=UPI001EDFC162|nr:phosphoribosyltransferase family protein [Dactylosporangium sp. AC04546]WVK78981.1 phosphoribosyltransferase family protein [Dactylosporangium sp. AC04546]
MEVASFAVGIVGLVVGVLALFPITLRVRRRYAWRSVLAGVKRLAPEVQRFRPDAVVGLADGAVPAAILALNYRVQRLYFVDAPISGRRTGRGAELCLDGLPDDLSGMRVLIIDNHVYTGSNLAEAVRQVRGRGAAEVVTMVVYRHVVAAPVAVPDHAAYDFADRLIPIPWSFSDGHKNAYIA